MAVCPGCDSGRADVQDRCCGKRCLARRLVGGIFSKSEYFKNEIVACCDFVTHGLLEAGQEVFFQNRSISKNEIVPCGDICHVWLVRSPVGVFFSKNDVFQKMKYLLVGIMVT